MNIVEDMEKSLEKSLDDKNAQIKEKNKHTGMIFQINPYERLEKKKVISNLGRNDKCFCGSEKKFKKCCLHAINFSSMYEIKENKRSAKKRPIIKMEEQEAQNQL